MLSTYMSYNLITRDLLTSLNRTAGESSNAREVAYYKENIGKVTSIDEFLDDYRLYSYAMKAYGLEEMTYAKAFMRKVLESDVSDANSFANLLSDERYRTFAAAFSFNSSGTATAQTETQLDEVIGLYKATAANAGAAIKEETRYYDALIGTVTSTDQLLNNERLRNYVFTAFGIDAATWSRETVKQVLTSDLGDPASYYNTVFPPAKAGAEAALQSANDRLAQISERATLLKRIPVLEADIPNGDSVAAALEAEIAEMQAAGPGSMTPEEFQEAIDVRQASLDDLRAEIDGWRDELTQARATVADIDALLGPVSQAAVREAALKAEAARQKKTLANIENYRALAAAFNFEADGTAVAGTVQTDSQKQDTKDRYTLSNPRVTTAAALMNRDYFESRIGGITTAADLIADDRLVAYIKAAFDLDKVSVNQFTIRNILTSDPDPENLTSYINRFGGADKEKYVALRAAFNFQEDGTLAAGDVSQTVAQTHTTTEGYMVHYNDKDDAADEKAIKLFKSQIGAVKSVTDFVGEASVYDFALKAFGLDPAKVSVLTIKNVLKSDLNDPKSYVYGLKDPRFVELAKAFNFGADGAITQPKLAQSEAEILAITKAYVVEKSRFGTADDRKLAEAEAKYYSVQIQKVESVKDVLTDPRLVAFVLTANGVDPASVDAEFVARIFASDLDDPQSFVNQQADRAFRKIVASFNFDANGNVNRSDDVSIQSRRGIYQTIDSYVRQMMEQDAGNDNAGVRLALYFERKAPAIASAYDILADDALFEVFKTVFSLPDEVGSADIDAQADLIKHYLDLKDLQDPEKVSKMIVKFAVLYDMENSTDTDPALAVLTASSGGGISADLMMSLAQMRIGGR